MKAVLSARSERAVAALARSEALHARVRTMIAAVDRGPPTEPFDDLAADLARFQAEHVAGYGRLCASRGVDPRGIARASDAPAVPTDAFKAGHVFAFDASAATATFRTSGTTLGARGTHFVRDLRTYDAGALAFGTASLVAGERPGAVLVLGPSPEDADDSSLAHMCGLFVRHLAPPADARDTFFVRGGALDAPALQRRVAGLARDTPALVLATSFALVHLLDALGGRSLPLPARSRVMLTGGFKGKAREVAPEELAASVAQTLGVDERDLVGEYGMTELSSQFWQGEPGPGEPRRRAYFEPPWARVTPVDPETLEPVAPGEVGIARIEDLANVDSAFAIVTADRVRRVAGGFELLGRAAGAPPRGCSIAIDEMLMGEDAERGPAR